MTPSGVSGRFWGGDAVAQVTVSINGRKYQVSCDDGQEEHLGQLAEYVDKRVAELVAAVGQVGDAQLLVMASLVIADELSDAYAGTEGQRADAGPSGHPADGGIPGAALEILAQRIDDIAGRLEQA